jgi:protein-tyrosine phosphatase
MNYTSVYNMMCMGCESYTYSDVETCKDCNEQYCEDCVLLTSHLRCVNCYQTTCSPTRVCKECFTNNSYHYITPLVAIGNRETPYHDFDIIINLNFPYNNIQHRNVRVENDTENSKQVFTVGLSDHEQDEIYFETEFLPVMLAELGKEENRNKSILFHCYAGISRSASSAIAYLKKYDPDFQYRSLLDIFNYTRDKRYVVCPNYCFLLAMSRYFNDTSIVTHIFDIETAIKMRSFEMVKYLIQYRGVDPNSVTRNFGTVLEMACKMNNDEIASYLLDKGSDPRIGFPLHHYIAEAHIHDFTVIDKLLEKGCEINKLDSRECRPLFYAKQKNLHPSIIEHLMDKGAVLY